MKRSNPKANRWEDHYARRAKKENFPARSVYKLEEIQQKYHLIKAGDAVLDLGCAPGSWLLYAARQTGDRGRVVGIDLSPIKQRLPENVRVLTGDVFELNQELRAAIGTGFQVVLSDMAPATTGNRIVDTARSFNLCQAALAIARDLLLPGGAFVCKIFQGEDFKLFADEVKTLFSRSKIFKPQSSRKASREIFIIGMGKK
ncbi:MAG: RlmE family RNA methyltransferase [Thermodesulfobacteriota bacterium]